jgi:hypothetical protein
LRRWIAPTKSRYGAGPSDRRAARHRLERRQPEALVARGKDERRGAAVEPGEVRRRDVPPQVGAPVAQLARELRLLLRPGDDQRQPHLACRRERRERILAPLDRAHEEQVRRGPVRPAPVGEERRVDAVRRHRDLRLGRVVELDEIALRALRHREHVVGPAHGARDRPPERRAVEPAHRARVALEREVVDGDDGAALPPERDRVLEVRELRPEPAEQARQRPRHAQLLRARGKRDRRHARGDEPGVARDRAELELGHRRRQLAQQVRDVRLVPGARAPEHVGVEDDQASSS